MICYTIIILVVYMKCNFLKQDDNELYGDDLNAVLEAMKQSEKLYTHKPTKILSDVYENINPLDVAANTANMMSEKNAKQSFMKLNAMANNVYDGDKQLKDNVLVTGAITAMLNNPKMNIDSRVLAAKLSTRLTNIPTTIQITSPDPNKKQKDADTHIIMPRLKRIYRPDYYVENYKAGNWNV